MERKVMPTTWFIVLTGTAILFKSIILMISHTVYYNYEFILYQKRRS